MSQRKQCIEPWAALLSTLLLGGCFSSSGDQDAVDPVLHGTIAYPFVDETAPLGRDHPANDKFVIRSAVGAREYTIEIPGAARDYDVQVPLAELDATEAAQGGLALSGNATRRSATSNPVTTDKEMLAAMPRLDRDRATDTALVDSAFGTGKSEGPRQAPSYTLGIAKINDHFKRREFEIALVEINNLITFYPNSPQLYKMKGTLLVKMRNLPLAELAWIKALELEPRDKVVRAALERLQRRIVQSGRTPASLPLNADIPKPVGTTPPATESVLSH